MLQTRLTPAGFVVPCEPSSVRAPPAGTDWLHEIKHDGLRLMVRRNGSRVCLFTRNDYEAGRYSAIVAAAVTLQARSFLIDGEAVVADRRRRIERGIMAMIEGCIRAAPTLSCA